MSYVNEHLLAGETVMYRTRSHWITFCWPVMLIWPVASILLGLLAGFILGVEVWPLVALVTLVLAISTVVQFRRFDFGITNQRILANSGWYNRRTMALQLANVVSSSVTQTSFEQRVGAGTITIIGTSGTHHKFGNIANPLELCRRLQAQAPTA